MEKNENKNEGFSSYYYVLFFNQPIFFFQYPVYINVKCIFREGEDVKKNPLNLSLFIGITLI